MASFETQPGNALARNQDKTAVRGLGIEFHDPAGMCISVIMHCFVNNRIGNEEGVIDYNE